MTDELFRRVKAYRETMVLAGRMLEAGLISRKEFLMIEERTAKKHGFQLDNCRDKVLADVKIMLESIMDFSEIDKQIKAREAELDEISTLIRSAIQNNASQANMQDSFDAKLERLRERYDAIETTINDLRQQKAERIDRQRRATLFLKEFEREDPIEMWDDRLWVTCCGTIER